MTYRNAVREEASGRATAWPYATCIQFGERHAPHNTPLPYRGERGAVIIQDHASTMYIGFIVHCVMQALGHAITYEPGDDDNSTIAIAEGSGPYSFLVMHLTRRPVTGATICRQ